MNSRGLSPLVGLLALAVGFSAIAIIGGGAVFYGGLLLDDTETGASVQYDKRAGTLFINTSTFGEAEALRVESVEEGDDYSAYLRPPDEGQPYVTIGDGVNDRAVSERNDRSVINFGDEYRVVALDEEGNEIEVIETIEF